MLNTLFAFAGPSRTTYQAKIIKPDGYPLEASVVNFKFTMLDPAGSCMLYSETFSGVNMGSSAGLVSFSLGSGVRTFPVSGSTFEQVFSNTTASLTCDAGGPGTYSPLSTDTRKIVMQFNDGGGWQTLPAMTINAVPYAMYANDSLKFNGKDITEFVQVASLPTCTASQAMSFNGAGFSCLAVGGTSTSVTSGAVLTALGYTPANGASVTTIAGDVSSVSSTVFTVVGSVTSLQNSVAASFAAITSSQWLASGTSISYQTGNVGIGTTTPVTKLDVSGGVRIGAESTTCAPALAGTLRYNASNVEYCNGTSWQAFGVSGSGITNFNGSTSGTQSFATGTGGTAPNINTLNGVHTLNIPLASTGSVTAGLISNTDYTTFTNKITSSAASIAQVLGYIPADNSVSGTYAQKANNLSDLTNITTARINLGLGTFATASSIDLGSASATGTLAIARLPSFTGDATIAAASNTIILSNSGVTAGTYTKVTVDAKGRVTSSAALASSDVTTALGYTPASASASTQWTTSGSIIYYNTGNVGIGTSSPASRLHVYDNSPVVLTVERNSNMNTLIEYKNTLGSMYSGLISGTSNWGVGTGNDLATNGVFQVTSTGRVYVGGTLSPMARLHITAGTSSVAPVKFNVGTLTTTPHSGTIEYDGSDFYVTDNSLNRRAIATTTTGGVLTNTNTVSSTSGITLWPATGNSVVVSSTVTSTNSSTGALIVNGGAGISGALNVGGIISGSATIKGTGFRANQGAPDAADSSTVGYAFGSDGDTGIFSPGSTSANGILSFYSNNAERMRMTASGALGIGIIPTAPLHISNTSTQVKLILGKDDNSIAESSLIKIDAAGSSSYTAGIALTSGGNQNVGAAIFRPSGSGGLYFKGQTSFTTMNGATTPDLFIGANGHVGVGIANPTYQFTVAKDFNGLTSQTAAFIGGTDAGLTNTGLYVVQKDNLGLTTNSSYLLNAVVNNSSRMVLTGAGNLGIGTTAPDAPLVVSGTGSSGAGLLILRDQTSPTGSTNRGPHMFFDNADGEKGWIGYYDNATHGSGVQMNLRSYTGPINMSAASTGNHLFIATSGNVGIGTAAPLTSLHVAGTATFHNATGSSYNENIRLPAANNDYASIALGSSSTATGGTVSGQWTLVRFPAAGFNNLFSIRGNSTDHFAITASGSVGIGTTTPGAPLSFADSKVTKIQFNGNNANGYQIGLANSVNGGDALYKFDAGLTSAGEFGFYSAGTSKMFISSSGNVGIGTSNPSTRFHVADGTNSLIFMSSTQAALSILKSDLTGPYAYVIGKAQSTNNTANFRYNHVADGSTSNYVGMGFWNNDDLLNLKATGQVGIGTTNPQATLHVSGTARIADGTQAAGRVLASDASGNASWKQAIIHGTINSTANSSTSGGAHASSGVSITLPPGRWQISGMGITSAASCRADFGVKVQGGGVVKYTLMPVATGDFQTATVVAYVDIASTTTYELFIASRGACTSQIHVDNTLWDLTATGVAY